MKRIINGVTYNLETATKIAKYEYDNRPDGDDYGFEVLYQTRGGAFFLHSHRRVQLNDDTVATGKSVSESNDFLPLTRDGAEDWIMTGNVEVFANVFEDPPEATEFHNTESTIYVRVPTIMKDRIEAKAQSSGLSVNAWALRRLEDGLLSAAE